MFLIAYAFKGHVHAFAGRVKVVSHSSCRTSAIFKYFCPLFKYEIMLKYSGLFTCSVVHINERPTLFISQCGIM